MKSQDLLVDWLNDAHMMEEELVKILQHHADDARDIPELERALRGHIDVTKSHAELLQQAIGRLGGKVSGVKSTLGKLMGLGAGPVTDVFDDTVLRNAKMDFAAEHFEIAVYRSIRLAADQLGDTDTVSMCDVIIPAEQEAAQRLDSLLPTLVDRYIASKTVRED